MNATDVTGPCAAVHAVRANYAYVWQLKDGIPTSRKTDWVERWITDGSVHFGYSKTETKPSDGFLQTPPCIWWWFRSPHG